MTEDPDDRQVREALDGMPFPADRTQVIDHAVDLGGIEGVVLSALRALPDRTFSTADDVVISVPERP